MSAHHNPTGRGRAGRPPAKVPNPFASGHFVLPNQLSSSAGSTQSRQQHGTGLSASQPRQPQCSAAPKTFYYRYPILLRGLANACLESLTHCDEELAAGRAMARRMLLHDVEQRKNAPLRICDGTEHWDQDITDEDSLSCRLSFAVPIPTRWLTSRILSWPLPFRLDNHAMALTSWPMLEEQNRWYSSVHSQRHNFSQQLQLEYNKTPGRPVIDISYTEGLLVIEVTGPEASQQSVLKATRGRLDHVVRQVVRDGSYDQELDLAPEVPPTPQGQPSTKMKPAGPAPPRPVPIQHRKTSGIAVPRPMKSKTGSETPNCSERPDFGRGTAPTEGKTDRAPSAPHQAFIQQQNDSRRPHSTSAQEKPCLTTSTTKGTPPVPGHGLQHGSSSKVDIPQGRQQNSSVTADLPTALLPSGRSNKGHIAATDKSKALSTGSTGRDGCSEDGPQRSFAPPSSSTRAERAFSGTGSAALGRVASKSSRPAPHSTLPAKQSMVGNKAPQAHPISSSPAVHGSAGLVESTVSTNAHKADAPVASHRARSPSLEIILRPSPRGHNTSPAPQASGPSTTQEVLTEIGNGNRPISGQKRKVIRSTSPVSRNQQSFEVDQDVQTASVPRLQNMSSSYESTLSSLPPKRNKTESPVGPLIARLQHTRPQLRYEFGWKLDPAWYTPIHRSLHVVGNSYYSITKRGDIVTALEPLDLRPEKVQTSVVHEAMEDPRDVGPVVFSSPAQLMICGFGSGDQDAGGVALIDPFWQTPFVSSPCSSPFVSLAPKAHASAKPSLSSVSALSTVGRPSHQSLPFVSGGKDHRMWLWSVQGYMSPSPIAQCRLFGQGVHTSTITGLGTVNTNLFSASLDRRIGLFAVAQAGVPEFTQKSMEMASVTGITVLPGHESLLAAEFNTSAQQVAIYDLRQLALRPTAPAPAVASLTFEDSSRPSPLTAGCFSPNGLCYGAAVGEKFHLWDLRFPSRPILSRSPIVETTSLLRLVWKNSKEVALLDRQNVYLLPDIVLEHN